MVRWSIRPSVRPSFGNAFVKFVRGRMRDEKERGTRFHDEMITMTLIEDGVEGVIEEGEVAPINYMILCIASSRLYSLRKTYDTLSYGGHIK